jgi:mono/diheme cytochrome c family protein
MLLRWLSLSVVLALAGAAAACPPVVSRVVYSTPVYSAPAYVAPAAVVAVPVAVPVFVPTYTAGYNPAAFGLAPAGVAPPGMPPSNGAGAQAQPAAAQPDLVKILERIDARLTKLEQGGGPLAAPKAPPPGGAGALALLTARCGACHAKGSEKDGGNFVLLADGKINPAITPRQYARIGTRTYLKEMPPPGNTKGVPPLTDEEVGQLQQFLNNPIPTP